MGSLDKFIKGLLDLGRQLKDEVEAAKKSAAVFDPRSLLNVKDLTRDKINALPLPDQAKIPIMKAFTRAEQVASFMALQTAKSLCPVKTGALRDSLYIIPNGGDMQLAAHLPRLRGMSGNVNEFDLVTKGTAGFPQITPKTRQALSFNWDRSKGLKGSNKSGILRTPKVRGLSGLLRTPRAGANSTLVFFKRIKARRGARANNRFVLEAQAVYEKRFKEQLAVEIKKIAALA